MLSAGKRKIDFFIIGAQKSGSSSLYRYVGQHPDIFVPAVKEINYFVYEDLFRLGEEYLEKYFADANGQQRWGAACVKAMWHPIAARRLFEYNPGLRLMAVLRNPIDRAYSAFWFATRNGIEPLETFEAVVDREIARNPDSPVTDQSYLAQGYYARQLRPYLACFPSSQVKIFISDDLTREPQQVLNEAFDWLHLDARVHVDATRRVNEATMPRFPALHHALFNPRRRVWIRALIPDWLRYVIRQRVVLPIRKRNVRPFSYPPMNPATRARLAEHFAPHNAELSRLLGRELAWQ
jgi:hypothetical protein